jgi:predicted lipoprotein with Yx(FWY)xxD motif
MLLTGKFSAFVLAVCAAAATVSVSLAQPVTGASVLTAPQGRTLYVFDNDVAGSGRSICYGACNGLHPPHLIEEGATVAEPFGVVLRDDGTRQWSTGATRGDRSTCSTRTRKRATRTTMV